MKQINLFVMLYFSWYLWRIGKFATLLGNTKFHCLFARGIFKVEKSGNRKQNILRRIFECNEIYRLGLNFVTVEIPLKLSP